MTDTSPSIAPNQDQLFEIIAHLGAALSQSIPSDDPIIIEHVRDAHHLALELRRGAAMSKEPSDAPV